MDASTLRNLFDAMPSQIQLCGYIEELEETISELDGYKSVTGAKISPSSKKIIDSCELITDRAFQLSKKISTVKRTLENVRFLKVKVGFYLFPMVTVFKSILVKHYFNGELPELNYRQRDRLSREVQKVAESLQTVGADEQIGFIEGLKGCKLT